jgi:dienelactone hydrolase
MRSGFRIALLLAATAGAALATPAPVIGPGKDADGKPLPFGKPAYYSPATPLGSGPYKAVMAMDPSLPDHTLYYPADMTAAGRLPVITWGNGACINAGNRFRILLTELASHGFLVVAGGPIDNVKYEVGPQENPVVRAPGTPPPAPPPRTESTAPAAPGDASGRNTAPQMIAALDWAEKANEDPASKFYHRLDVGKMGTAGQSCGGSLAVSVSADPRIKTSVIFSGAGGLRPRPDGTMPEIDPRLDAIHAPILLLSGDTARDIANPPTTEAAAYLTKVPMFHAWQEGLEHIGTYGMAGGGELGRLGWQWFAWQLRGDKEAAKTFKGANCGLCTEGDGWHVDKKNID